MILTQFKFYMSSIILILNSTEAFFDNFDRKNNITFIIFLFFLQKHSSLYIFF